MVQHNIAQTCLPDKIKDNKTYKRWQRIKEYCQNNIVVTSLIKIYAPIRDNYYDHYMSSSTKTGLVLIRCCPDDRWAHLLSPVALGNTCYIMLCFKQDPANWTAEPIANVTHVWNHTWGCVAAILLLFSKKNRQIILWLIFMTHNLILK